VSGATSGAASAKAKKAAGQAEKMAQKKLEEAKKEMQRMQYQGLSLDLAGYKSEQEMSQVAAAMAIGAGQEADGRTLAAIAGRSQMADIEQQRQARIDKGKELDKLNMIKADERVKVSDQLARLDLQEAEGAQIAAAEADRMAAEYQQQAVGAVGDAVKGAANLYSAVQGPYDPNGVSGAMNKNINDMSPEEFSMYKSNIMSNPDLAPIGADGNPVQVSLDMGTWDKKQMVDWGYQHFKNPEEVNNSFSGYRNISR
jgi:hypothetical protein